MFKVNNKNTTTMSFIFSTVSITDFEQVNVNWDVRSNAARSTDLWLQRESYSPSFPFSKMCHSPYLWKTPSNNRWEFCFYLLCGYILSITVIIQCIICGAHSLFLKITPFFDILWQFTKLHRNLWIRWRVVGPIFLANKSL